MEEGRLLIALGKTDQADMRKRRTQRAKRERKRERGSPKKLQMECSSKQKVQPMWHQRMGEKRKQFLEVREGVYRKVERSCVK